MKYTKESIYKILKDNVDSEGFPTISTELFEDITKEFGMVDFRHVIIDYIVKEKVPYPYNEYTEDEVVMQFKNLSRINVYECVKVGVDGFTKWNYKRPFSGVVFTGNVKYNVISNYFQYKNRLNCPTKRGCSAVEAWQTGKAMPNALASLWRLITPHCLRKDNFRKTMGIQHQIASQFRPHIAKTIYDIFDCETVLDLSCGWGDRLAGFYTSKATKYIGFDPNTTSFEIYKNQIELYDKLAPGKETKLYNLPAEDVPYDEIEDESVDMVFTSPPYFAVEKYSEGEYEDTQSWKRYQTPQSWRDDFLFNIIEKVWSKVKVGGHLAINITDVLVGDVFRFCDDMCDYIETLPNAVYSGHYGMDLKKRPGMALEGEPKEEGEEGEVKDTVKEEGIYYEPVWVFRKGMDKVDLAKKGKPTSLDDLDIWD